MQNQVIFKTYNIKDSSVMERKEYFNAKNWTLLDIEYIQCTRTHRCIRKFYILAKNGYTDLQQECIPCEPLHKLEKNIKSLPLLSKRDPQATVLSRRVFITMFSSCKKTQQLYQKTMRSTLCSIKGWHRKQKGVRWTLYKLV